MLGFSAIASEPTGSAPSSAGAAGTLIAANCTQSATSGTGAITQTHTLTAAPCTQSATSGTGSIGAGSAHILIAANCTQANTCTTGAISSGAYANAPAGAGYPPRTETGHRLPDNRMTRF